MTDQPFISVIIPCYNDGAYLPETLRKLKEQTYKHFETIVVNDGSTDALTLEVLEQARLDGLTVLDKPNGHLSSARNFGIRHARGSVIVTLDADDYYHPSFFEKGLRVLSAEPGTGVVSSYIQMFGKQSLLSKPRGGDAFNFLFSNQCPACAMYRKECWDQAGPYDENMKHGYEDWEFYIRVTARGWKIHVIPKVLFYYRQTDKSMHATDTVSRREELVSYIVDKHRDWYLSRIKTLIVHHDVIYRKSRVSFQNIYAMLRDRLTGRY